MKLIPLLVLSLFISCKYEKTIELPNEISNKDKQFILKDKIILKGYPLKEVMNIIATKQSKFVVCSYNAGEVLLFDSLGVFQKKILSKDTLVKNNKKVGYPFAITQDSEGTIYISDNKYRRIYIIKDFELTNSFIISGHHISPISLAVDNKDIYMGGYDKEKHTYIHKYSLDGKYLQNFRTSELDLNGIPHISSVLNYPSIKIIKDRIFSVELLRYNISCNSLEGDLIFSNNYFSLAYPKDNKPMLKNARENIGEVWDAFSKQVGLLNDDKNIYIVHEMPIKKSSLNYYQSRKYFVDILNEDGKPLVSEINFANEKLFQIEKGQAFTISVTKQDEFLVKKYNIKTR